MTPETVDILRQLARRPGDVGTMARAALALEGLAGAPTLAPLASESGPLPAENPSTVRWRRWNDARKSVGSNASNVGQTPSNALANASLSPSVSAVSSVKEPKKETETPRESAPANANANGAQTRRAPTDGDHLVSPGNALPDELREAASIIGVRDVPGAWLKFCGHYAGKTIHVAGWWQKWCANERKREQAGPRSARVPLVQPTGSDGKSLWEPGGRA